MFSSSSIPFAATVPVAEVLYVAAVLGGGFPTLSL